MYVFNHADKERNSEFKAEWRKTANTQLDVFLANVWFQIKVKALD